MKKVILLILAIGMITTACKKENTEEQGTTSNDKLSPPAWIQGTWMDRSTPSIPTGYKFTSDDMFTIISTNSESLSGSISDREYSISESHTDTNYQFTITYSDSNSNESWQFNKIDDTHIESIHGTVTTTLIYE